ncbi:Protein arginine N-methyltransferase 7, partial [Fasciola gigantica]
PLRQWTTAFVVFILRQIFARKDLLTPSGPWSRLPNFNSVGSIATVLPHRRTPLSAGLLYSGSSVLRSRFLTMNGDLSNSNSPFESTEYELVPQFNPTVGRTQWKPVRTDYDYAQEIALSGYGDMLHDSDRNQKYFEAIRVAIKHVRNTRPDVDVHVLDIGTGTGLLSMMAAFQDAKSVTACEAFRPMVGCAKAVLKDNGLDSRVQVVDKPSTKLSIPNDLPQRANLLVAELVDTELIGEACLSTYKHASESLITPDAVLVPHGADLYCQIVESPFLWSHHRLCQFDSPPHTGLTLGRFDPILHDMAITSCPGAPSVFDIQASELEAVNSEEPRILGDRQIRCLLEKPVLVKHFNFSPPANQIQLEYSSYITKTQDGAPLTAVRSGTAHAFIVWWRMNMEPTHTVPDISTAPTWACDPDSAWRDHWMQAVYFPRQPLTLMRGQKFQIAFRHDLLSLWFDFPSSDTFQSQPTLPPEVERPICNCGLHYSWPRTRIAHLHTADYQRTVTLLVDGLRAQLNRMTPRSVHIVVVSDCSLLPIFLSETLGLCFAGHTIRFDHIDSSACSFRFLNSVYNHVTEENQSPSIRLFDSADSWIKSLRGYCAEQVESGTVDSVLVVAEPFAVAATLPWDAMHFWYAFHEIRSAFPGLDVHLFSPLRLRIWGVLMEFDQLWKIRAPIGADCEGFNLSAFDRLVQPAMRQTQAAVEPQPLWEYGGEARSEPQLVFDLDLATLEANSQVIHHPAVHLQSVSSEQSNVLNGIAFWSEWLVPNVGHADRGSHWYAPAGPELSIRSGERIRWKSTGVQQGVTLFPTSLSIDCQRPRSVPVSVSFHVPIGEFQFALDTSEQ